MRIALETVKSFAVSEFEEPAAEYLAHKLEQIENGEPTGSRLDEIISRSTSAADFLGQSGPPSKNLSEL